MIRKKVRRGFSVARDRYGKKSKVSCPVVGCHFCEHSLVRTDGNWGKSTKDIDGGSLMIPTLCEVGVFPIDLSTNTLVEVDSRCPLEETYMNSCTACIHCLSKGDSRDAPSFCSITANEFKDGSSTIREDCPLPDWKQGDIEEEERRNNGKRRN